MRQRELATGTAVAEVAWADDLLDPHALTIGFARRFATYKRANLLLAQADRLQAILLNPDRPVQFVFAGKAHPADDSGKEMIRQIVAFARELGVRHRFVFLDDYDIAVARTLYQGSDIWLNTPRRPHEACGTSGMKAALNGTVNCSVLDGWWDELYDGENGWAIPSAEGVEDEAERDRLEADALFDLLERQVIPLYFDRPGGTGMPPRGWLSRVKHNLASLGPQVVASRMVRDYVTGLYEPTAAGADRAAAEEMAAARDLAAWKNRIRAGWDQIRVESVEAVEDPLMLGEARSVAVSVALGSLSAVDVTVQLVHGPVGQGEELLDPLITTLSLDVDSGGGSARFSGTVPGVRPGRYGFTVRLAPSHPNLCTPLEMGLLTWG